MCKNKRIERNSFKEKLEKSWYGNILHCLGIFVLISDWLAFCATKRILEDLQLFSSPKFGKKLLWRDKNGLEVDSGQNPEN